MPNLIKNYLEQYKAPLETWTEFYESLVYGFLAALVVVMFVIGILFGNI